MENSDEITKRHRQERKDLQAKITALKKTISKNDKKKKKELSDSIAKLEEELNEKHRIELLNVETDEGQQNRGEIPEEIQEEKEIIETHEEELTEMQIKVSRAQRRRNKKESENKEREQRISEQEVINKQGPRILESNTINEMVKKEGLKIHNIPADGNCLYCAIQHQLGIKDKEAFEIEKLRGLTAEYMRANKDDFLPFMCNESGDEMDEGKYEEYCRDVAKTKLWGGQLEIKALSNILKTPIKVIQASGPPSILGDQFEGESLILTYHRHLYRLGEHYNSTEPIGVEEEDEDETLDT